MTGAARFLAAQVVDFGFEGGVVDLRVGEAVVNSLQLQVWWRGTTTTQGLGLSGG